MSQLEALKARIQARYTTIHAFCRAHPELKRATVYLVLSRRYPGNVEKQTERIRAALEGSPPRAAPSISQDEMAQLVQNSQCNTCRKLDKGGCRECKAKTLRGIQALHEYMFPPADIGGVLCQRR